jgi:soluble lytic murein transglycosylase-like protein
LRHVRLSSAAILVAFLAFTATAQGAVPHIVQPGETLWSIAAASNFTTRALAAANGLPETAPVIAGSTIQIPSEAEAAAALAGSGAPAVAQPTVASPAATATPASGPAPGPMGAYTVEPGDTLSGIAASSEISVDQLAWMNGIDPAAPLLMGTVLKLPTGASLASRAPAAPAPPAAVPDAEPYATPGYVTATAVGSVATQHGVPPAFAAAVAWQESGFNNGFVSTANARGVMQILPGTWMWVEDQLAGGPLDPASPLDNVRAGVLYLGQLLRDSGGDQAMAAATYYQGSSSVGKMGLLPETERYVENVMALRSRFGGP